MTVAPLWRRFMCFVYESLLVVVLALVSSAAFYPLVRILPAAIASHIQFLFLLGVLGCYFVWCWRRSGQTLPMKTWGIRLESEAGCLVTPWRAAVRYALCLALYCPLVAVSVWGYFCPGQASPYVLGTALLVGVSWARACISADGQFLHDRLAGSRLVMACRQTANAAPDERS